MRPSRLRDSPGIAFRFTETPAISDSPRTRTTGESGVISGFGARVDPVKAGWHSSAYVTLSIEQSSWQLVRDRLLEIPEVEHIASHEERVWLRQVIESGAHRRPPMHATPACRIVDRVSEPVRIRRANPAAGDSFGGPASDTHGRAPAHCRPETVALMR